MTYLTRRLGVLVGPRAGALADGSRRRQRAAGRRAEGRHGLHTRHRRSARTHTFNLVADTGYIETPDGNSVFMWSYADADRRDARHFQSPGPVLCVTQGQTVVVNLTNNLPEATSIVFPGQDTAGHRKRRRGRAC